MFRMTLAVDPCHGWGHDSRYGPGGRNKPQRPDTPKNLANKPKWLIKITRDIITQGYQDFTFHDSLKRRTLPSAVNFPFLC